jgi:hypothetical protein
MAVAKRWPFLLRALQACLFILLIEDHARLKDIFKYQIMKPDFKLADSSLMREVELLQQSAAFLFGAGVVAGFTAGTPRGNATLPQDAAAFFAPSMWALWGVIAAFLLFAVLSAFFARMMASMLWSLAKDYLDRLTLVYDQMDPESDKLKGAAKAWEMKKQKNRKKALLGQDIGVSMDAEAESADAVPAAAVDKGAKQTLPDAKPTQEPSTSAAAQAAAAAAAASSTKPGNNKQMKQLIYWNALGPSLMPGINTVRAFISLAKICFLSAVDLWLVVFMFIAFTKAGDVQSLWAVVTVTLLTVVVMGVTVICMVKYVFAVFQGYHMPDVNFWPAEWETIFTFPEEPGKGNVPVPTKTAQSHDEVHDTPLGGEVLPGTAAAPPHSTRLPLSSFAIQVQQ